MNRIRAVIAASSMTLALGPCSPAELREWSQTTGIEVDATAQQHIADCHAASVEADALAPEHDYLDLDTAMRGRAHRTRLPSLVRAGHRELGARRQVGDEP